MTDLQLTNVLTEAQEYMLSKLPEMDVQHEFSPKFKRKMKRLIRMEKYPILYRVQKMAVTMLIAMGLFCGLLIAVDEEARAGVIGWVGERFAKNGYVYRNGVGLDDDVSHYTLEDIAPEEYKQIDRHESRNLVHEIYAGENGSMLVFTVMSSSEMKELNVVADKDMMREIVYVNGMEADLFLSGDSDESNEIVWQDKNGALFCIRAVMDKETLIKMAEKINKLQ